MSVTAVFDTYNPLERFIQPGTPEAARARLLASSGGNTKNMHSAQLTIKDELGNEVSLLIDNIEDRPVLEILGADDVATVMLTAHDIMRIRQFFDSVVQGLAT